MANNNWLNTGWLFGWILVMIHFLIPAMGQQNPYFDPRDNDAVTSTFYLTSRSDCGDDLKNIYGNEAVVAGKDPVRVNKKGPTSCTIRLTSSSQYPGGVQLQINILSMNIGDCDTHLSIYDGQGTQLLGSFDCHSNKNINRQRIVTTGDTVSFVMSRPNEDSMEFDIQMRVKRIGSIDQTKNTLNYFNFQKFDQEAIVGMISGLYALILIICICVVCYCNSRYRGLNKKWETHQLATMKTDTAFESRSQVSQPPWSVGAPSQRIVNSQYSRSFTETHSRRGPAARSEDGSSVYDEKFQQRNLMNEKKDRYRGRDRIGNANSTYSDDEGDDPDNFKEKVITPRVETRGRWKPKDRRPPSFEEATRSSSRERSSEEDDEETETEESSDNDSTRKRLTTSSEEESSGSYTESESEESSDGSRRGARAKRNKKKPKRKEKPKRRRESSTDDASSQRTEPRRKQPQPQPPPLQAGVPYGAYLPPGGQFVMAGPPPQFQPVHMVPPNYPPPQYPVESSHPPATQPNVKPTEPPVYSYLVRRGYTPLDPQSGGNSQASSVNSTQRIGPTQREEPDIPLQSGVDYMRR